MRLAKETLVCLLLLSLLLGCRRAGPEPPSASERLATPVVGAPDPVTAPATTSTVAAPPTETPSPPPSAPTSTATPFAPPDLRYLDAALQEALAEFEGDAGTLASYYVADLSSGQTIAHNAGVAISGMSLVKIPILVEVYRKLEKPPSPAETTLITETATLSGNYTANLLLELIAGRPDPFAGAAALTASLRQLQLYDTFIAVPYELESRSDYLPTYATLANQQTDVSTNPDSSMQTTTRDLGRLLTWIYQCSQGEGHLLAGETGTLTAAECEALLAVMAENKIEAFIEAGVPAEVPIAHKHGWVGETHGDAGIVLAPEHPYVLVVALHRPGWLEWAESTELIARLSRLAYDHFTSPSAYPPAQLATPMAPLPSPTATSDLPQATVVGTQGAGLTLRERPGGAEVIILPEGLRLYLLPEPPLTNGGVTWRHVAVPGGVSGWVGDAYLALDAPPG